MYTYLCVMYFKFVVTLNIIITLGFVIFDIKFSSWMFPFIYYIQVNITVVVRHTYTYNQSVLYLYLQCTYVHTHKNIIIENSVEGNSKFNSFLSNLQLLHSFHLLHGHPINQLAICIATEMYTHAARHQYNTIYS